MDVVIIAGLSATVVGFMEYLKGFIPEDKRSKVPPFVYRIVLAGIAVGVSFIKGGETNMIILNAISVAGFSHLGYEGLVALIKSKTNTK